MKSLTRGFLRLLMTILTSDKEFKIMNLIWWSCTQNLIYFEFFYFDSLENYYLGVFEIISNECKVRFWENGSSKATRYKFSREYQEILVGYVLVVLAWVSNEIPFGILKYGPQICNQHLLQPSTYLDCPLWPQGV